MAKIILSESSGLLNSIYGKLQTPIAARVDKKMEAVEKSMLAWNIFDKRKSENYEEAYTDYGSVDSMLPVGEGGAYPNAGMYEGYVGTLANETWKSQVAITRELIDDSHSNFDKVFRKTDKLSIAYKRTVESFCAALLGSALNQSATCTIGGKVFSSASADGKCQFSHQHLMKYKSGYISNAFTNAFSLAILDEIATRMQNFTNDEGEVLGLDPDTIIIPNVSALKRAVWKAVATDHDPGDAYEAFNYQAGRWNVIVWPYLNKYIGSLAAPYIIMDSQYNKEANGAIFQDRNPLEIRNELDANDNNLWKAYTRFSAGFIDFRVMAAGGMGSGVTTIT